MTIARAYLIDARTGEEMKSHPLHGKTCIATGGNAKHNGEWLRGTATNVEVCDYASMTTIKGKAAVTAGMFDHPVVVKIWFGRDREGVAQYDWRYLVREGQEFSELDLKRAARCEANSNC